MIFCYAYVELTRPFIVQFNLIQIIIVLELLCISTFVASRAGGGGGGGPGPLLQLPAVDERPLQLPAIDNRDALDKSYCSTNNVF